MTKQAECAKAIRSELKQWYPSIKFSIRSESFAGGNAVRISYTDGVSSEEVEKIVKKYQDGYFDGQTDCYEYTPNALNLPRAKYVRVSRTISPEKQEIIKKELMEKWGISEWNNENCFKAFGKWPEQEIWSVSSKINFLSDK